MSGSLFTWRQFQITGISGGELLAPVVRLHIQPPVDASSFLHWAYGKAW